MAEILVVMSVEEEHKAMLAEACQNAALRFVSAKDVSADEFSKMKKGAFFLNVGRGTAVDTEALCDALESGHLAGAALDVTDPEPLPKEHRLWDAPGVLITPHVSGGFHLRATHDRIIAIAARNIRHFLQGEAFENLVDKTKGYRKNS